MGTKGTAAKDMRSKRRLEDCIVPPHEEIAPARLPRNPE
jgi:hypothetical protein